MKRYLEENCKSEDVTDLETLTKGDLLLRTVKVSKELRINGSLEGDGVKTATEEKIKAAQDVETLLRHSEMLVEGRAEKTTMDVRIELSAMSSPQYVVRCGFGDMFMPNGRCKKQVTNGFCVGQMCAKPAGPSNFIEWYTTLTAMSWYDETKQADAIACTKGGARSHRRRSTHSHAIQCRVRAIAVQHTCTPCQAMRCCNHLLARALTFLSLSCPEGTHSLE